MDQLVETRLSYRVPCRMGWEGARWGGAGLGSGGPPPAPSYSFPPGGLQGGFELPWSFPPGLGTFCISCPQFCFRSWGLVPEAWGTCAVARVAAWGSLTCCSALRGSFSEWATHSFIRSRMMGMRLTTPP